MKITKESSGSIVQLFWAWNILDDEYIAEMRKWGNRLKGGE